MSIISRARQRDDARLAILPHDTLSFALIFQRLRAVRAPPAAIREKREERRQ